MSQAVCRTGVRRASYRGLTRVRLEHVLTAAVLDLLRLDAWWTGTPLATIRTSHCEQLALALAA